MIDFEIKLEKGLFCESTKKEKKYIVLKVMKIKLKILLIVIVKKKKTK